MTTLEVFFRDGDFLRLDLITDFHRKGLSYIKSTRFLINSAPRGKGIFTPDPVQDFEYGFLFSILNGAGLPASTIEMLHQATDFERKRCLSYLKGVYGIDVESMDALFPYVLHVILVQQKSFRH